MTWSALFLVLIYPEYLPHLFQGDVRPHNAEGKIFSRPLETALPKMSAPKKTARIEVLHLSMPRTGSVSMMEAYNTLGLMTYHGFDYCALPKHQILWEKAIDAEFYGKGRRFEKDDFDDERFLGPYQVLSDLPVIGFSERFLEFYPDVSLRRISFCMDMKN